MDIFQLKIFCASKTMDSKISHISTGYEAILQKKAGSSNYLEIQKKFKEGDINRYLL